MEQLLIAGGGDSLACDAVDLVEGVRLQDPLISRADEDLQAQRLFASVSMQLKHTHTQKSYTVLFALTEVFIIIL